MSTTGAGSLNLKAKERIVTVNAALLDGAHLLVGITCVRNEALILRDTLDYVGAYADAIVAYDDASTDETRDILKRHPKVALVIENDYWEGGSQARLEAETRHRGLLLDLVRQRLRCEWLYCFDADERLVGEVRDFLGKMAPHECNGVRVRLFDAYLTPTDQEPIRQGQRLLGGRRYFGPERRDILMLWRNTARVSFRGLIAREPAGVDRLVTHFDCQHYGKAISISQWESTCDFYIEHFPLETYGQKWLKRKGHAVHDRSDFGGPLYEWGHGLFANAIPMAKVRHADEAPVVSREPGRPSVLLATNYLFGSTGSETLYLTLVEGLRESGCEVTAYVRHLDLAWARHLADQGVRVLDRLDTALALKFDIAHVQHNACLVDVRVTFPTLPVLFSSLGIIPILEQPVPFDCRPSGYLAISEEVAENLVAQGVPGEHIVTLPNLVCEQRFSPHGGIHETLRNILVISHKIDEARKIMLRSAAREIGASIRFIGGATTLQPDQLAVAINESDVVVSLGRGVIEAMLCGRVPLVYDIHGGDGLVTPDNVDKLLACNFSGRFNRQEFTIDDLVAELNKYRPEYGMQLRDMAERRFGLRANLPRLLEIYRAVQALPPPELDMRTTAFVASLAGEDQRMAHHFQATSKALEAELARVKGTVSWRITGPFRAAWNLARKFIARRM